jgi:hypothetical protein
MLCKNCQSEVIDGSKYCNHCGKELSQQTKEGASTNKSRAPWNNTNWIWIGVGCLFLIGLLSPDSSNTNPIPEPTKASQSKYNQNMSAAYTSYGLTKADLAWHAVNTYGWNCPEVLFLSPQTDAYYLITCSNDTLLRVYPRPNQHPKITNMHGGYN